MAEVIGRPEPDIDYTLDSLETIEPTHRDQLKRIPLETLKRAPVILGAVATGAVLGVATPGYVEFAPGVSATISAHKGYTSVSTGAPGGLELPALSLDIPIMGKVGGKAILNQVNVPSEDTSGLLALINNNGEAIEGPAINFFITRAIEGGVVGAIGGATVYSYAKDVKDRLGERKTKKKESQEAIAASGGPPNDESLDLPAAPDRSDLASPKNKEKVGKRTKLKRFMQKVGAGILLGGIVLSQAHHLTDAPDDAPKVETPLDPQLAELSPILKDAIITGTGGQLVKKAVEGANNYMEKINQYWIDAANQTIAEIEQAQARGDFDYLKNPDLVTFVHISDVHANLPYIKYYLGSVLNKLGELGINYIIDTGDNYNGSNTSGSVEDQATKPMEKILDAISPQNQGGQAKYLIYVGGNHDPFDLPKNITDTTFITKGGQKYHPITELNKANDYKTTVNGITIVGSPDYNRTVTGKNPTTPPQIDDQIKNDFKQGEELANAACQITRETGKQPVVASHEQPGGLPAAVDGCASVVMSGHYHVMNSLIKYTLPNGETGYIENIGSASGDGHGNQVPIYSMATTEGGMRLLSFSRSTGRLTNMATIGILPNNVTILDTGQLENSRPIADDTRIRQYLGKFAPDLLPKIDAPDLTKRAGSPLLLAPK